MEQKNKYISVLSEQETERAIKLTKDTFQTCLSGVLNLTRVTAPMIVKSGEGINDDLNGETPIRFTNGDGVNCEIVHSLAKWKRMKLGQCPELKGIYTDMNAIRTQEHTDAIHSIYVDQWDWEARITDEQRSYWTLRDYVNDIYGAIKSTKNILHMNYPQIKQQLPNEVTFLLSEEMSTRYNNGKPITADIKQAVEDAACKEFGAVFVVGIGHSRMYLNDEIAKYDDRAADYDDWNLNGDLLIWDEALGHSLEISSMGIRVDATVLARQLKISKHEDWANLKYHKMILNNELPLTIGGGIGQSRLCMLLLEKKHIGEVQTSIWTDEEIERCKQQNIHLL